MRSLDGISHVSLTVSDMQRARRFWTTVMGFEVAIEVPGACVCVHRGSGAVVGFRDHAGAATGPFDETRVGMDHIALAVSSVAGLDEWSAWLDEHDVTHSDVAESDLGHHLNLRAPENIAVELFVLNDEIAAALGLG
jgi:catechol 2,3-dioxygenase-like lactoylglutathione lyase family enzyme